IPMQARSVQPHEAARSYAVTRPPPAVDCPACPILAAMNRPRELTGALLGALLIGTASMLAGCMATRYEAPPEVVPQPPAVTTSEVLAEDQAQREEEGGSAQDGARIQDEARTPDAARMQDPPPLPEGARAQAGQRESASEEARRVGRFRPTGDSI